jgi:AcrR family transcriptional regulator
MPAEERRRVIIDAASRLFAERGYVATTTAQLAAAASVTEPILYRHFPGKRDLYLACIDDAWAAVREALEGAIDVEGDPAEWSSVAAKVGLQVLQRDHRGQLWIGALTEPNTDEQVREVAARHLRDLHTLVADLFERARSAGGNDAARNVTAEAWIFLAVGVLYAITSDAGGPSPEELDAVLTSRQSWLRPT